MGGIHGDAFIQSINDIVLSFAFKGIFEIPAAYLKNYVLAGCVEERSFNLFT